MSISPTDSNARGNAGNSAVRLGIAGNSVGTGDGATGMLVGIAVGSSGVDTVSCVPEGEDSALEQAIAITMTTVKTGHKRLLRMFKVGALRA